MSKDEYGAPGYTVLCDRGRVGSENKLCSCAGVFGKTSDGQILVVERWVVQKDLGCLHSVCVNSDATPGLIRKTTRLFDNGQDPRLVVVVAVCANSKVDFFGEGVSLVRGRELEDAEQEVSLICLRACGEG